MAWWRDIKQSFSDGGIVTKLIYINIAVFVVIRLTAIFVNSYSLISLLGIPTDFYHFICYRPWTIFTYMFTHFDFIHIIFNLLCLFWFGRVFCDIIGSKYILKTYIIGGLAGALACLVGSLWFNVGSVMIGASAANMAILLAITVFAPNYKVLVFFVGNIPLKFYAAFFIFVDIVSVPGLVNSGGHLAHLGGALAGACLALLWKHNSISLNNHHTPSARCSKNLHVAFRNDKFSDFDFNAKRAEHNREIDRILDKMKQSGYDSLSSDERKTLFDESKR